MSIPSLNKPSDYDKYFSRYLADLNLQVKLNQDNYDANVAFFKTGVQATERADTRSLEQRSTDVETLKIQARAMLNKLTNSNAADEVLTHLINNNLLFFFVQNFVDFERTINKRYPSQTASAPILRVLIQKSFDKQNEEIPLLKDELIVATNSVASREIIQKVLTDVYNKQDTNVVLYETLKNNLFMFPTMQEKLNIVKFPEKKFKDENDIQIWNSLPSNKTIEQLLDLYEQLYSEDTENVQSILNQINNIEDGIENQLSSVTDIKIKSKIDQSKANKQLLIKKMDTDRERKELLENTKQRITLQKSKATQEQLRTKFKKQEDRDCEYDEQSGMANEEYLQKQQQKLQKEAQRLKERLQERELIHSKYTNIDKIRTDDEAIKKDYQRKLQRYEQDILAAENERKIEQYKKSKERQKELVKEIKNTEKSRGNFKPNALPEQEEFLSIYPAPSKPRRKLKPKFDIQAFAVEQEEPVLSKKVKSVKAKEDASQISDSLLQPYLKDMFFKSKQDIDDLMQQFKVDPSEVEKQYGNSSRENVKKFIATQLYNKANKYTTDSFDVHPLDSLNELTRGSYYGKAYIPDPNASISRQPSMEGTGLLTKRQQDSHRFKVLQGQILAGNNSKKIVMELKALILKMTKLGEISNKKASAVLQELNSVLK